MTSIPRLTKLRGRAFVRSLIAFAAGFTGTAALARGGGGRSDGQIIGGVAVVFGVLAAIIFGAVQKGLEKRRLEREIWEEQRLKQGRLKRERLEQEKLKQERLERERLNQDRLEWDLLKLRERIEQECPESVPDRGLLRAEMLTEIIRRRPTNRGEWFRLPLPLRESTDREQFKRYGEEMFEIVERCLRE